MKLPPTKKTRVGEGFPCFKNSAHFNFLSTIVLRPTYDEKKDEDGKDALGKKRSQEEAIIEKEEIYREFI